MKFVVVFRSARFSYRGEPGSQPPPGGDLAGELAAQLKGLGIQLDPGDPIPDEDQDGWAVYVRVRGQLLYYFVHWVPLGIPPVDHWAVQMNVQRGVFGWLTRRTPTAQELESYIQPLRDALTRIDGLEDVRWLTDEEFAKLY